MGYLNYRKPTQTVAAPPLNTYADGFSLEEHLDTDQRIENESWLLSYIDVFLLIIAFLIMMLLKSNNQAPVSEALEAKQTPSHELTETLKRLNTDQRINVTHDERQISIRLDNTLLFDSSKAVIQPDGKKAILTLIPTLKTLNKPLVIEGHTDNTPINTALYPSNWELSAARANSVLHYLASQGIPKSLLSTANYADTRPLAPNNTQTNRRMNRRVNLLILVE